VQESVRAVGSESVKLSVGKACFFIFLQEKACVCWQVWGVAPTQEQAGGGLYKDPSHMLLQNIWFTGIKLLSDTIEDTVTLIRYLLLSLCVCLYSYVGGQTPVPLFEEFKPINVFSTVPGHSSI